MAVSKKSLQKVIKKYSPIKTLPKLSKKLSTKKRQSTKKRSVKKRSVKKHSAKKRSVKKRLTKKRSAKKRSAKKRSTKKRSAKKRSAKKRSTKKRSTKKRSTKKRSTKKRSTKRVRKTYSTYDCRRSKIARTMSEFKNKTLKMGKSGKIVKNRKQAIAIALSQADKYCK